MSRDSIFDIVSEFTRIKVSQTECNHLANNFLSVCAFILSSFLSLYQALMLKLIRSKPLGKVTLLLMF